ncbi:MAG: hypothetical protein KJ556_06985 [Gammaproteobacteria bacterium]|nr:hypothetical protein [Gammaproteobacteria bacterium]MBU2057252.1 hypothetical protein [Gammaproteobacteria bacterium]MBU2174854.1 hypothetical protein [Gammaproteobacteria bacterium]MBU2245459.1 hypothetical protein [Gammaproteobacteria bacterium]MBU2344239.1 hypothetical protein [Gammaproteobacteria bacterium]
MKALFTHTTIFAIGIAVNHFFPFYTFNLNQSASSDVRSAQSASAQVKPQATTACTEVVLAHQLTTDHNDLQNAQDDYPDHVQTAVHSMAENNSIGSTGALATESLLREKLQAALPPQQLIALSTELKQLTEEPLDHDIANKLIENLSLMNEDEMGEALLLLEKAVSVEHIHALTDLLYFSDEEIQEEAFMRVLDIGLNDTTGPIIGHMALYATSSWNREKAKRVLKDGL